MARRPALKAILFDIDDTLYSTRSFVRRARRNALQAMRKHGVRLPIEVLSRELEEIIREFGSNAPDHYEILLRRIGPESWRGFHPAIAVAAAVAAYHDTKPRWLRPYPDAVHLLRKLHRTRLKVGIVSDGLMVKQAEKLLRLGIYPYLDPSAIFISEQVGISKPNPKIYTRACEAIPAPPAKVLYVGNSVSQDVLPAREAGLKTAFIRRGGRPDGSADEADHVVDDFYELGKILRSHYGVPLR